MWLMNTGQASTHAAHDVQDHSTSSPIASDTMDRTGGGGVSPAGVASNTGARSAMYAFMSCMTPRGESGFPDAHAGHCSSQRPQFVQASKFKFCHHVKSVMSLAPKVSSVSKSPIGLSAPRGLLGRKKMFAGLTAMWDRCL